MLLLRLRRNSTPINVLSKQFTLVRRSISAQHQSRPATPARTRFAPSPTGYLHIGSLRTALFNFLLARATGGQFILRIEDTDKARTVADAESRLCEDLKWAGITWDEGADVGGPFGPYRQSERSALHREHAEKLLNTGHAYRCFCSETRLRELAAERARIGLPSEYDRTCESIPVSEAERRASNGEPNVIRLRVPEKYPPFQDLVYGRINPGRTVMRHGMPSYEDPVLIKSDGMPTYHLANVVDDHYMKITHVIRAVEWMPSTPKHIYMYDAFKWTPPAFAHVGLLQNEERQKFSKRHKALDIRHWDQQGYLPQALVNHVALLGWSHKQKSDVLSIEELIKIFNLKFTKGNAVVTEEKLSYLQAQHVKRIASNGGNQLKELEQTAWKYTKAHKPDLIQRLEARGLSAADHFHKVFTANLNRYIIPAKFLDDFDYLLNLETQPLEKVADSIPPSDEALHRLSAFNTEIEKCQDWDSTTITEALTICLQADKEDVDLARSSKKELLHAIRWAVAGGKQGPSIADTLLLLGREVSLKRIDFALRLAEKTDKASFAAQ